MATTATAHEPPTAPEPAAWRVAREQKRKERAALIPEEWRLSAEQLASVPQTDVPAWLDASGLFSDAELRLTSLPGWRVAELIANNQVTCEEATRAICHRAAVAHQITNCLTEIMFDDAIKRAQLLDASPRPNPLPPLFGLPFSIKDLFDYPGVDSTIGLAGWIGNKKEGKGKSVVVRVIEEQGGIVFAKTNIPQIMMTFESWNPVFGTTLNPHNLALTAGGSSSGEAALVAMRGSWIGVGTDIGGSVRIPGVFDGLYTLRPTIARLSRKGGRVVYLGTPGGIIGVQGPMANNVEDLELYVRAFVGSSQRYWDPDVIPVPWTPATLRPKLKFGVYYTNNLVFPTPPVVRGVHIVAESLRAAGHEVVPFHTFESATLLGLMYAFWTSDGHADLKRILAESGETPDMYIEDPFLRFGNGKFLDPEWAGDEVARQVGVWEEKAGGGKGTTVAKVWELIHQREKFKSQYLEYINELGVDAIICPAMSIPANPHRTGRNFMSSLSYTMLYSLLDWSAGTVPVDKVNAALDAPFIAERPAQINTFERLAHDFYTPEKFANAPTGVQVVCRRFEEEKCMSVMKVVDGAIKAYKEKGGRGEGFREVAKKEWAAEYAK